jgi:hypothetical protein
MNALHDRIPAPKLTPRQFRVCKALAQLGKLWREEVDSLAGASNGPEVMRQLRIKGLEWKCERVLKIDRYGRPCEPGLYSVESAGRETLNRWGM